jgi:fatty acid desaturase
MPAAPGRAVMSDETDSMLIMLRSAEVPTWGPTGHGYPAVPSLIEISRGRSGCHGTVRQDNPGWAPPVSLVHAGTGGGWPGSRIGAYTLSSQRGGTPPQRRGPPRMHTGTLNPPTTRGSDFAARSQLIARAGLMRRRPGYYLARIGLVTSLYIAGWVAFAAVGDSWYQLIVAPCLAVAFAQLALVAHDIAHRQVFRTRRASEIAGLLAGNLGIGMSYGWWMDKHTRHHANPNHEQHDPDMRPDVLVWSTRQAQASTGISRLLGRWQALLFFPLLTLEGLALHVHSVRALTRPTLRRRATEAPLLILHVAAYLGAVLLVLSPARAIAFLALHMGLFGVYVGCTFAPNHKGMPMLTNDATNRTFCAARCSPHATYRADTSSPCYSAA